MTALSNDAPGNGWRKVAVLVLAVAAIGLPVNNLADYALLLVLTVIVFSGEVSARPRAWAAAGVIVAAAVAGQALLSPPRIEEGHNVFLPGPALERALPSQVYRHLANEFDALYPPAQRCARGSIGCWQGGAVPDSAYAFSADSVWLKSDASRAVHTLDFSDPVWARLGFVNESRYNWYTAAPDVHRSDRDRRFWAGLQRWQLAMPWYEMVRLPAAYVGGELCWRGALMWEGEGGQFSLWRGDGCRAIEPADAGRRIFGIAIKPGTLAMHLTPPWTVRLLLFGKWALALMAAFGLIAMLVRFQARRTILPFLLIGLAVVVVAPPDGRVLGGGRAGWF